MNSQKTAFSHYLFFSQGKGQTYVPSNNLSRSLFSYGTFGFTRIRILPSRLRTRVQIVNMLDLDPGPYPI
jgi:hypothetical protein